MASGPNFPECRFLGDLPLMVGDYFPMSETSPAPVRSLKLLSWVQLNGRCAYRSEEVSPEIFRSRAKTSVHSIDRRTENSSRFYADLDAKQRPRCLSSV
jgi:hypothetical protein